MTAHTKTRQQWKSYSLTSKAGRDKIGLTHKGTRVADFTIHTDEDAKRVVFIVRACNSHDALVAALKKADSSADHHRSCKVRRDKVDIGTNCNCFRADIRAALSLDTPK